MLAPEQILDLVTAEPFRPFRMDMASGRTFEVGRPEMVVVRPSSIDIDSRPEDDSDTGERWEKVSLMLLEPIVSLEVPSGQKSG